MAEQADGSIIVDTEIDPQGFRAGSAELQRAIKSLNTKIEALGPTFQKALSGNASALSTFDSKAAALETTISQLEAKLESLGNARVPTEDYQWLTTEIQKAENELAKLEEKQIKMEDMGVSQNSQAWKSLQYDIDLAKRKIEEYKDEQAGMRENGTAFQMGSNTAEYAQLESALASAKARLAEMRSEVENAGHSTGKFGTILTGVKTALVGIGKVGVSAFKKLANGIKSGISHLRNFKKSSGGAEGAIGKLGKKLTGVWSMIKRIALRKILMGVIMGVKDAVNNLALYSKSVNANLSTLKSALTQLKNSLATAFAPILTVVTPALAKLISYLATAVTYIGKLFAALTGAKTFTKATAVQEDYAASLDETGKAAKDAKRQLAGFDDLNILSDSGSDNGGGGGSATPAEMFEEVPIESSITDFINRLKEAFRNGEYSEIGKIIGEKINEVVQKIDDFVKWENVGGTITKVITGVAEAFNSLVDTIDWELIGKTLADSFNTVLHTLYLVVTEFDWLGLVEAFATGLNSFVNNIDWALVGKTISEGIKTVLGMISTFLKTTDWSAIGGAVKTVFDNIDWKGIAAGVFDVFKEALKAVFELIHALPPEIQTVAAGFAAWKISSSLMKDLKYIFGLPTSLSIGVTLAITGITLEAGGIADAIQNELDGFNFAEIIAGGGLTAGGGALIGQAFGSAILGGAIGGVVAGLPAFGVSLYDAIVNGLDWLNSALIAAGGAAAGAGIGAIIGMCGGPIGAGIGALIGLAVGLVTDGIMLIIDNWDAIVDFLSNFFTVTIPNMWNSFVTWITKTVPAWFKSLPDKISKWFSDLWQPIKDFDWKNLGYNIGQWFGNAVKDAINFVTVTVPNWLSSLWNSITSALKTFFTVTLPKFFTEWIPQAWEKVKKFFAELPKKIWEAIKSGWNWLVDTGKAIIDGIWEGLQTVWQAIKDFVSGFVQGFKDALGIHSPSTVFKEIGENLIAGLLEGIKAAWTAITNFFSGAIEGLKNLFSNAWSSIKNTATTAWNGIKTTLSGAWNGIKTTASNAWNGLKTTISTGWNNIKTATTNTWNTVKSSLSNTWNSIKSTASTAWTNIKTTLSGAWDGIKTKASETWSNLKSTVSTKWTEMKTDASEKWNSIKTNLTNTWNGIKSTASTTWSNLKTAVSTKWTEMKTDASEKWNTIKTNLTTAWNGIKSTASTTWTNLKSTVTTKWTEMKTDASEKWNSIKTNLTNTWNGIKSTASTTWTNLKSTISTKWTEMKTSASSTWDSIKTTLSGKWDSVKSTASSKFDSVKSTVATKWSEIKNSASSTWDSIKSTLSGKWDSIKSTASSKFDSVKSTISDKFTTLKSNASTWGKHICDNLSSGIKNGVSAVGEAAKSVASKIKSLLGFSEPEDGPLSNFHTYMPDMIDLMTSGIKDNQGKAIGAVSDMASAISNEMQNGDYALGEVTAGKSFEGSLISFSDTITDGFSTLIERLQSIANGVTFATPTVAKTGLVPYSVTANAAGTNNGISGAIEASNDELASVVIQAVTNATTAIVGAIQSYSGTTVNLDSDSLATNVIKEINRRTRMSGNSPLVG